MLRSDDRGRGPGGGERRLIATTLQAIAPHRSGGGFALPHEKVWVGSEKRTAPHASRIVPAKHPQLGNERVLPGSPEDIHLRGLASHDRPPELLPDELGGCARHNAMKAPLALCKL
jgi:hypothetical protein